MFRLFGKSFRSRTFRVAIHTSFSNENCIEKVDYCSQFVVAEMGKKHNIPHKWKSRKSLKRERDYICTLNGKTGMIYSMKTMERQTRYIVNLKIKTHTIFCRDGKRKKTQGIYASVLSELIYNKHLILLQPETSY